MTLKVVCYGVRPNEVPFFEKLNKYNFENYSNWIYFIFFTK